MENKRQIVELADIFSSHEKDFLQNHKLCSDQLKAFTAIIQCRTAVLGGHIDCCDTCGYTRQLPSSLTRCTINNGLPKPSWDWYAQLQMNILNMKHLNSIVLLKTVFSRILLCNQIQIFQIEIP